MEHHDIRGPLPSGPLPSECAADVDAEWAEYVAWLDREAAAGREPGPMFESDPVLEPGGIPGVVPLGDTDPWTPEPSPAWASYDPDLDPPQPVAAGPALFAEDGVADLMAPSPFLAALTEQAVTRLASLSDSELVGVLRASRRQVAREHYKQALAAAEFGRRRQAAFDAALARGVPAGCAPGGFPGEELAAELVISRGEAGHLIDDGIDLTGRLPRTLDLDHTIPWPAGPTDQCNLAPRCRVHHRAKQAPDWTVEQIAPGVTRWTMPSGRTHITTPTKYDA